jgi:hypothetical protein
VGDGAPAILNFSVKPGFLVGTVTLNGGDLSSGYVYAYGSSGESRQGSLITINPDGVGTFNFPVIPDSSMQVYGQVSDSTGKSYSLKQVTLNVPVAGTVTQDWVLSVGAASISGVVNLNNGGTVDYRYLYAYGPNGAYAYQSSSGSNYAFTGLDAGDWTISAYSSLNSYDDYFQHPPRTASGLQTSEERELDIIDQAAFINGTLALSGSKGLADLYSATLDASGVNNTAAAGGYAQDRINPANGDIDLIVTGGDWLISQVNLMFYDPTPGSYLYSYVYVYSDTEQFKPLSLANGQMLNNLSISYQTGTVTVNFSVADEETPLRSPELQANCTAYDSNNLTRSVYANPILYAYGYAYGPSDEVLKGKATFVGVPADCQLTAFAIVNGTRTTFGQLAVTVLPGTDIEQDIGGPELTVATPASESYTTEASVEVTGTAKDDVGVTSITVNSVDTTFTSNNPNDAKEVSFTKTLDLSMGPNIVKTVASDASGKSGSDTRTVYRDTGPPTLNWMPADGSQTSGATVSVQGTATDEAGISAIKVNNAAVDFTSSDNLSDPNEVTFSTTVSVVDGANVIEVSATDKSKRSTTQTHTVTKVVAQVKCDVDSDGDIDQLDLSLISKARNKPASGPNDLRDANGDGRITVADVQACIPKCTRDNCATQ